MHNPARTRRRLTVAMIAIFAIVGVFVVRLIDLQVVRADELNEASANNRGVAGTTYGTRGEIVDTGGTVLADSVLRYDVTVDPTLVADFTRSTDDGRETVAADEALEQIAALTGTNAEELRATIDEALADNPQARWARLVESVDVATRDAIDELAIPWQYFDTVQSRTYPNGALASNLVGFMGTDAPRTGLELMYDDSCLAGTNGSETYERSADGVRLPGSTVTNEKAEDGGTLRLTIDSDLQWFVQQELAAAAEELGAQFATAAVVRVEDGHLLAVADYPTFDPNNVTGPDNLGSRFFTHPFESGSVMKPPAAAILIDQGQASPYTQVTAPYTWQIPGAGTISDWFVHPDTNWTFTGAIANSSNTAIAMLTQRLDDQTRYDYMTDFGFGQKTAIDFSGESPGQFYEPEKWDGQTRYNMTFGQGIGTTGAQLAGFYQALGNDGVKVPLTLVEGCERADGTVSDTPSGDSEQVFSASTAEQVRGMMERVVTDGAFASQFDIPGYRVSAKTGTGEVASGGTYTASRNISVAGVGPSDDPQYAVVVSFVEPTESQSSSDAAPTFSKIFNQVFKTYRVPPSSEPAPDYPMTW